MSIVVVCKCCLLQSCDWIGDNTALYWPHQDIIDPAGLGCSFGVWYVNLYTLHNMASFTLAICLLSEPVTNVQNTLTIEE